MNLLPSARAALALLAIPAACARVSIRPGTIGAPVVSRCTSAAPLFQLPYMTNSAPLVTQGVGGPFTHQKKQHYAWDFGLPEGSAIVAAADGIVVEVIQDFEAGGMVDELLNRVNQVVIDHGNNRFSVYAHLKRASVFVREGDRVSRGQKIALSGNTGWTTGPHLHFEVVDYRGQSLPACFAGVPGGWPRTGVSYASDPVAVVSGPDPTRLSTMPRDAFAENGILLDRDLPTHWLSDDSPVEISGIAPGRSSGRVLAFLKRRETQDPVRRNSGEIALDGGFSVALDWRGFEGPANFAIGVEGPDGMVHSRFTVPVSIRRRSISWEIQ